MRKRHELTGGTVWLHAWVCELLLDQALSQAPNETGGMLLGYTADELPELRAVVTHSVEAGPGAVREPTAFEPDGAWQQERLERIYESSGHITSYVGDWHSHPLGPPDPSRRDRRTARLIAQEPDARAPNPLTVIVSPHAERQVAAYRLVTRRLRRADLLVAQW
jgi:integrative and conjugative element protein (TIGR02256 family)